MYSGGDLADAQRVCALLEINCEGKFPGTSASRACQVPSQHCEFLAICIEDLDSKSMAIPEPPPFQFKHDADHFAALGAPRRSNGEALDGLR